jgi:hypothetical protein
LCLFFIEARGASAPPAFGDVNRSAFAVRLLSSPKLRRDKTARQ